jgi:hypothetical protein
MADQQLELHYLDGKWVKQEDAKISVFDLTVLRVGHSSVDLPEGIVFLLIVDRGMGLSTSCEHITRRSSSWKV